MGWSEAGDLPVHTVRLRTFQGVAQLAEYSVRIREAEGSSPSTLIALKNPHLKWWHRKLCRQFAADQLAVMVEPNPTRLGGLRGKTRWMSGITSGVKS